MLDHVTYDELKYEERMREYDEIFEIVKARVCSVIDNVTIPALKERFGDSWRVYIERLLTKNPADDPDADFVGVLMVQLHDSIMTAINDFSEIYINEEAFIEEIGYDYPFIVEWLKAL